jgi:hypothetical protein
LGSQPASGKRRLIIERKDGKDSSKRQAASCKLQAPSCKRQAASSKLQNHLILLIVILSEAAAAAESKDLGLFGAQACSYELAACN